jgi:hypothetical protein
MRPRPFRDSALPRPFLKSPETWSREALDSLGLNPFLINNLILRGGKQFCDQSVTTPMFARVQESTIGSPSRRRRRRKKARLARPEESLTALNRLDRIWQLADFRL